MGLICQGNNNNNINNNITRYETLPGIEFVRSGVGN
jgi:hypothetical protein